MLPTDFCAADNSKVKKFHVPQNQSPEEFRSFILAQYPVLEGQQLKLYRANRGKRLCEIPEQLNTPKSIREYFKQMKTSSAIYIISDIDTEKTEEVTGLSTSEVNGLSTSEAVLASSRAAFEDAQERNSALHTHLVDMGFAIKDVDGDGNCLFRSIAYSAGDETQHAQLRAMVAEKVRSTGTLLCGIIDTSPDDGNTFGNHVQQLATDGVAAGEDAIIAASEVLRKQVYVYISPAAEPRIYHPSSEPIGNPIYIAYFLPGHYVALTFGHNDDSNHAQLYNRGQNATGNSFAADDTIHLIRETNGAQFRATSNFPMCCTGSGDTETFDTAPTYLVNQRHMGVGNNMREQQPGSTSTNPMAGCYGNAPAQQAGAMSSGCRIPMMTDNYTPVLQQGTTTPRACRTPMAGSCGNTPAQQAGATSSGCRTVMMDCTDNTLAEEADVILIGSGTLLTGSIGNSSAQETAVASTNSQTAITPTISNSPANVEIANQACASFNAQLCDSGTQAQGITTQMADEEGSNTNVSTVGDTASVNEFAAFPNPGTVLTSSLLLTYVTY
jgi:hypothetical protein